MIDFLILVLALILLIAAFHYPAILLALVLVLLFWALFRR